MLGDDPSNSRDNPRDSSLACSVEDLDSDDVGLWCNAVRDTCDIGCNVGTVSVLIGALID